MQKKLLTRKQVIQKIEEAVNANKFRTNDMRFKGYEEGLEFVLRLLKEKY